eukprot:179660-Amphidinium_carterae.2
MEVVSWGFDWRRGGWAVSIVDFEWPEGAASVAAGGLDDKPLLPCQVSKSQLPSKCNVSAAS